MLALCKNCIDMPFLLHLLGSPNLLPCSYIVNRLGSQLDFAELACVQGQSEICPVEFLQAFGLMGALSHLGAQAVDTCGGAF